MLTGRSSPAAWCRSEDWRQRRRATPVQRFASWPCGSAEHLQYIWSNTQYIHSTYTVCNCVSECAHVSTSRNEGMSVQPCTKKRCCYYNTGLQTLGLRLPAEELEMVRAFQGCSQSTQSSTARDTTCASTAAVSALHILLSTKYM